MKKNKKIVSLLLVLIFTFSLSFPSAIAAKTRDSIQPYFDFVQMEPVTLASGESHTWGSSNGSGFFLLGKTTYEFSAACIDNEGTVMSQPFQVQLKRSGGYSQVYRSKKNDNGYIYGVQAKFTIPSDGYYTLTVTNQGLSEKNICRTVIY